MKAKTKIVQKLGVIFLLPVLVFSCGKNEENIKNYPSGNIEYIKNDSVDIYYYDTISKIVFEKVFHEVDYDSLVFYYKNGNVFKNGKETRGRKFGNWDRYTLDGFLSETREYFIVKDESILNREWYFNKKGDTLWYANSSNRYNQKEFATDTLSSRNSSMIPFIIYSKDTITLNEPFLASVICNSPLGRKYNSQIIMLLAKEDYNFNKYFSNDKEVKLDTFYNLLRDKKNRINFNLKNDNEEGYRYISAFGRWFDKPGEKILRGYMLEYFDIEKNKENYQRGERRVYFEKRIYVKDTINGK